MKIIIGMMLLLLSSQSVNAQPVAKLTKAQAVRIAQEFVERLGIKYGVPDKIFFPTDNPFPNEVDAFWKPRWHINFGFPINVEVADDDDAVVAFSNWSDRPEKLANPSLYLSKPQVLNLAATILYQSGFPRDELLPADGSVDVSIGNDKRINPLWRIQWQRHYNGIPYTDQWIAVTLDAESGECRAFGVRFTSPPPNPIPVMHLSTPQAVSVASDCLSKFSFQDLTLLDVYPMVVLENDFGPKPNFPFPFYTQEKPVAHVAWVVRSYYYDNNECYVEVWVDMATGQIVGGTNERPRGGRTQKPERLSTVLRNAKQVRLFTRGPRGTWRDAPEATLSSLERSDKLALLRTASDIAASPKPSIARVKAEVQNASGQATTFFVSTNGEIIGNGQRAQLPPAFARWANTLATAKPAGRPVAQNQVKER